MQSNGLRGARYNSIQRGAGLREQCLRFAMRDEPGIQVARAPRVDLLENIQLRVVLIEFHDQLWIERRETARNGGAGILRKNDAQTSDSSTATRFACAPHP